MDRGGGWETIEEGFDRLDRGGGGLESIGGTVLQEEGWLHNPAVFGSPKREIDVVSPT